MARYTRWSRRLSIVAPPSGRARQSESGQTVRSIIPASRPTITKLKPPPVHPGNRGGGADHDTGPRFLGQARAVDDALTRGLRSVIGGRGTAVIRNMRG